MKLANGLSFVSTRVILALVFFLVITPLGVVKRLTGWDPLDGGAYLRRAIGCPLRPACATRATLKRCSSGSRILEARGMAKLQVLGEFWEFLRFNKKYWLLPIVIVLVLTRSAESSWRRARRVAPFVYTLF